MCIYLKNNSYTFLHKECNSKCIHRKDLSVQIITFKTFSYCICMEHFLPFSFWLFLYWFILILKYRTETFFPACGKYVFLKVFEINFFFYKSHWHVVHSLSRPHLLIFALLFHSRHCYNFRKPFPNLSFFSYHMYKFKVQTFCKVINE